MLFNSYPFLLLFVPITFGGFFLLGARGHTRAAVAWLVLASLLYYGWWKPIYVFLLTGSVVLNYALGLTLMPDEHGERRPRWRLALGIGANLATLGYFKYANFFLDNLNALSGADYHIHGITLPLAISFFTFQQITYLVDAWRGETREYRFVHYCLFVTFFPQLIAGPIVHHKEMLPQFESRAIYRFSQSHFAVGLTIFFLGLFKKVMLADGIAVYATPVFAAADAGHALTFFEAWSGALAYTFQLYFDFSGYSDMAIGLARMIGVRLPLNFNSPYKATSIIDFWRRWHMTLSRFLRDYLYFPLGGNRRGRALRYRNLLLTMLLGGLWHGAAWTFVFWGALHGLYLVINHAWRTLRRRVLGHDLEQTTLAGRIAGRLTTFLAVVVGWVFFRAETFGGALRVLEGMTGANGFAVGPRFPHTSLALWLAMLFAIVWLAPNTQQLTGDERAAQAVDRVRLRWAPNTVWALAISAVALTSVVNLAAVSEFLYFNF